MSSPQLAFTDVRGGMNAADPPHKIGTNQVARMVNCALVDGLPTTRLGGRVVPLSGSSSEFLSLAPVQGSIFYNAAKGQGGIRLSADNASLATAAGGRKFLVKLIGRRERAAAEVNDITGGLFGNPQHHLVWLSQWENLLVAADGEGPTFIYQPETGSVFSKGYNTEEKDQSEIPNGATVLLYAHARGIAVVNSRNILVGDSLHRVSQTTSLNLREFTDQVYWATGKTFLPPSSMGPINAASILALKNTVHGHGDVMFHLDDGIFSLDINHSPRSEWENLQLVKHAVLQAGAAGPYAVANVDGDQFYRTRIGAQSLRSAAATAGLEGNPIRTLSTEVDTWLTADYPRWLRFSSVNCWDIQRRVLFTVSPIVRGSSRSHRGFVVRNLDPVPTTGQTPGVWEGLWTLPPEMSGIVQFVNGIFEGEQRQFAWTVGEDELTRLVEFSPVFRDDYLSDGTRRRIRCQVQTRAIDAGKWWETREFQMTRLYLRNIAGEVRWSVSIRTGDCPTWQPYRSGIVTVPDCDPESFGLVAPAKRSITIPIGKVPDVCLPGAGQANKSRSLQFLVRWEGYCSFEGIRVTLGEQDLTNDDLDCSKASMVFEKPTAGIEYNDFEYAETAEALW